MKRHFSISLRLTAWFGTIFLLGWILFGAAMYLVLKTTLISERKNTLARRLDRLEDLLDETSDAGRSRAFEHFASATGNGLMEVVKTNGQAAMPSPSSSSAGFNWPRMEAVQHETYVHVQSADAPYLVIARPSHVNGLPVTLLAAAPEAGNQVLLHSFFRGMEAFAPVLLFISMAGGYWTSRRALQPVDRITGAARSISIRNLSERVPVTRSHDELQRLAETYNQMLDGLEGAVRRLKQFTADASHELRGPLSLTRTIAEVAMRNTSVDEMSRQAFAEIVEESAGAAMLLEQMLVLARADSDMVGMVLEPVSLGSIVDESCAKARTLAMDRQVVISLEKQDLSAGMVLGNRESLSRLVWILLDNALKYTPEHGRIEITLRRDEDKQILRVEDNGIGITPSDLPRIFDRFFRADPSRSQVEGNGLGLSIAKWIADAHHAEIHADSMYGHGSCFTVTFVC